jgi:hypothetical protein
MLLRAIGCNAMLLYMQGNQAACLRSCANCINPNKLHLYRYLIIITYYDIKCVIMGARVAGYTLLYYTFINFILTVVIWKLVICVVCLCYDSREWEV